MMESDLPLGSCNSTGHLSTIGYHTLPGRMHHSASTPAGVDGAGAAGGARTPPATPKKAGKMLALKIQMLDDSISMFQIQSKALGRVLFDQVCRQLHLLEADYFGLEYHDVNGTRYWLDVEKPICAQVGLSMLEPTLRFCVKFYTPDPARLEEEFTRYLFCLQVKRDLALGSIQCNENTAALMASYIVQAECGDFVPEDYPDHSYLSGYKFFPAQDREAERRIMENHKKHIGQSPAEADLNLLETARRCEFYGIKMHPTKDHENVPLSLAVGHLGVVVFQNCTRINTFSWAKIRKISFKRKKFIIKLHPEGYGYYRDMVEFFFEGRNECKNFWKKCVENHGFFRCSSVPRAPRHKARVMSRGSSFRYSGKTQKQIVEFVRDNYVKRQTFQRSGSFRAPRSLRSPPPPRSPHSPRALSASLSAHPLLPLPPGSDAISLEWDKQPHYLEASLMMKGYSAAEAREAAARPARPATALTLKLRQQYYYDIQAGPEVVTHAEVNHHPTEDSPLPHRTTTPLISPESTWSQRSSRRDSAGTGTRTRTDTGTDMDTGTGRARARTPPSPAPEDSEETAPEEDHTVSSASLLLSPWRERGAPLSASTPHNGRLDKNCNEEDVVSNGNLVAESTNSIDVLSAGGSDAGDTLRSQKYSKSMSSNILSVGRDTADRRRRAPADSLYYFAKEMLMTERTYKRDLELITVTWSLRVSSLARASSSAGAEAAAALGRPCLALEPVALKQGAFLVALERALADAAQQENEEPQYKKVDELLYDYLSNTYDAYSDYITRSGVMVARVESWRRRGAGAGAGAAGACAALEAGAPLPLAALLLRPLHAVLHYAERLTELSQYVDSSALHQSQKIVSELRDAAVEQLQHAENHAALCQLQRDIAGYDKLLVAERSLLRLGLVRRRSPRGPQPRMMFLFSDVFLLASRGGGGQFRALCVAPLAGLRLENSDEPNTFIIHAEETSYTITVNNEQEYVSWWSALDSAIERAAADAEQQATGDIDVALTPADHDVDSLADGDLDGGASSGATSGATGGAGSGALAHVCWHRATSLSSQQLYLVMRTTLSGYLLRKFKKSMGWQRLWVVAAAAALHFYKAAHDTAPLVALPVLGYSVGAPAEADGINKEFVFKLQFKNHVYFFRADSLYSYQRWVETLRIAAGEHGS